MKSSSFDRTNPFRWILSNQRNPYWNMAIDEAIFKEVAAHHSPPTLRFYTWDQPSVSIGYFQNPVADLNLSLLREKEIPWVRRITGGKGIFHHQELTYSFSAPLSLPTTLLPHDIKGSYKRISLGFAKGFRKLRLPVQLYSTPPQKNNLSIPNPLCFSIPSWYETLIEGKKVVGSAQKRFKKGFLQQGTILLSHRLEDFNHIFRLRPEVSSDFLGIFDYLKKEIPIADLENSLVAGLEEELEINFKKDPLTGRELRLAEELVEKKYKTDHWNLNRIVL